MTVKLIVFDVDGTLTDGKLNISENGELFKSFDVKDGYAIKEMLPTHKIKPVIITSRLSRIVENRCKELRIETVFQGARDKLEVLSSLLFNLGLSFKDVAYMGDDINDLPCITRCSVSGCPSDAVEAVKKQVSFIASAPGGAGAAREFIEWLIETRTK